MSELPGTSVTSSADLSEVNGPLDGVHDRGTAISSSEVEDSAENTRTKSEAAINLATIPSDDIIADRDAVVPRATADNVTRPSPAEDTAYQGSVLEPKSLKTNTSTENGTNHGAKVNEKLVLDGSCPFERLPPLGKKVVRIFVSSTFSDTKEERNALMERVYPKLSDFCRDNYGLEFQVVDMRWGVPEHASDNHSTSDLCINEIIKCQELSAGPNFVAFIGNRYGYRPIPSVIAADELDKLRSTATSTGRFTQVDEWYALDNNSLSPIYVLQPVSAKLKDSSVKNMQMEWSRIEPELSMILREAAKAAQEIGLIDENQMNRYFMSVTENEIKYGILESRIDPTTSSVCIIRNIIDIKNHLREQSRAAKFADVIVQRKSPESVTSGPAVTDVQANTIAPDEEAEQLLRDLREIKVPAKLPPNNVTRFEVDWKSAAVEDAQRQLQAVGRGNTATTVTSSSALSRHVAYIDAMCRQFYTSVTKLITASRSRQRTASDIDEVTDGTGGMDIKKEGPVNDSSTTDNRQNDASASQAELSTQSGLPRIHGSKAADAVGNDVESFDEVLQHLHFARSRCEMFHGREDTMSAIRSYLAGPSRIPLVVYGPSGCGKTSVIAKTASNLAMWADQAVISAAAKQKTTSSASAVNENSYKTVAASKRIVTVVRFLGTTPRSSNVRDLLSSVCRQLMAIYGEADENAELLANNKEGKKIEQKAKFSKQKSLTTSARWQEPDKMSDLVAEFQRLLGCARRDRPILLLLDSIDQLSSVYDAYKVTWLPIRLPQHVKLVVSTLIEGYEVFDNLCKRYNVLNGVKSFIEVGPLGQTVGLEIVDRWLNSSGRRTTTEQRLIVSAALEQCSYPLYARLVFDQVRQWPSFYTPESDALQSTVQGAIGRLYEQLELKFGTPIVRHSFAYLTAARQGLSETELEHILSLDDRLLGAVYAFWKPPVRRIPPLLWTRLRADLGSYVVERAADGGQRVLGWYHRQFAAAARSRYLAPQSNDGEAYRTFTADIHEVSAEFFSGRWGGGKPKPFKYTEQQVKRFELDGVHAEEDRKVPLQPYRIRASSGSGLGSSGVWINRRRLSELPWHLLQAAAATALATIDQATQLTLRQKRLATVEKLKRRVFFDFDWLYSKLKSGGGLASGGATQALIDEIEFFMEIDKEGLGHDAEMRTLVAVLRLVRPYVDRYPESLGFELSGRLVRHVGFRGRTNARSGPSAIERLIIGCDRIGSEMCVLRPTLACFKSADPGLRTNITVRSTEPWVQAGAAVVVCNRTMTTAFIVDYDDHGVPALSTWDLETGDRVSERVLVSGRLLAGADKETAADGTAASIIDVYVELRLIGEEEDYLLALYVPLCIGMYRDNTGNDGFADVIRLSDGAVVRTMRESLSGQPFHNSLLYLTKNWVAIRFGWGVPLFNIWKDVKKGLTKPHALTADESKFVLVRSKKVGMKSHHNEEKVTAYSSWTKMTTIHSFSNKQDLGTLDKSESFSGVTLSADSSAVLLADGHGNINVYDIGPSVKLAPGKLVKVCKTMSLPSGERITVFDLTLNDKEKQSVRQTLISSPCRPAVEGERSAITHHRHRRHDDAAGYVIGCFKGVTQWEAFLWSLSGNGRYVGRLCSPRRLEDPYPRFNHDGRLIVDVVAANSIIRLIRSDTGLPVRVYNIGQTIRGVHVSSAMPEMGLLIGKDFLVYDISLADEEDDDDEVEAVTDTAVVASATDPTSKQQSSTDGPDTVELLPAEHVTHVTVHRRIVARRDPVTGDERAVEVSAVGLGEDEHESVMTRLNSARVDQRTVLETWSTPDSSTVIHLYTRMQVIDSAKEEIVYSPRSTDRLQRLTPAMRLHQQQQRSPQQQLNADQQPINKDLQGNGSMPVDAVQSNQFESIDIQDAVTKSGISGVQLAEGDRIVGDGNKIRLRVTSSLLRLASVPSVLSVGFRDVNSGQFDRKHRIRVYQTQQSHKNASHLEACSMYVDWRQKMPDPKLSAHPANTKVAICRRPKVVSDFRRGCRAAKISKESILTLSNHYLVTCSYKKIGRYVNVYELTSGKLLCTHACGAGNDVILARLSVDELRLYLAESDLTVRLFSGNSFVDQLVSSAFSQISPRSPSPSGGKRYAIRDLLPCCCNPHVVVLCYNDRGTVGGAMQYVYIDVSSGRRGQTVITPKGTELEDISRDCRVGVDDSLVLYDMREGTTKMMLPYIESIHGARLQARLSDDAKYVVFIDRQDTSLHIIHLDPEKWSFRQVASCVTHALSGARLTLRCGGRVAVITDSSHRMCLLAIAENGDEVPIDYSSERHRAVSILAGCCQRRAANQQTLELKSGSDVLTSSSPMLNARPLSSTKDFRKKLAPLANIRTPSDVDMVASHSNLLAEV